MSDQPTQNSQNQQPPSTATQQPQQPQQPKASRYQPNRNVQPPQYQIVTEGYDPRVDITRKDKNG